MILMTTLLVPYEYYKSNRAIKMKVILLIYLFTFQVSAQEKNLMKQIMSILIALEK